MLLRNRVVGLRTAFLLLPTLIGCAVVPTTTEDFSRQRGKVAVPPGEELDVYYPVPFASPPNLRTETTFSDCSVIEQKPDHFRIKNPNVFSRDLTWEARGVYSQAYAPVPGGAVVVVPTPFGTLQPASKPTDFGKGGN